MRAAGVLGLVLVAAATAHADPHPPITDRNYDLDLYQGSVLGAGKTVGMGGAIIALVEGAGGIENNPAAPAVRTATSHGTWDWDLGAGYENPSFGADYDNNGSTTTTVQHTLMLGISLVGQYKEWALGIDASLMQNSVSLDDGSEADPLTLIAHLVLARSFLHEQLTIGVGVKTGSFSVSVPNVDGGNQLFSFTGASFEAGAVWRPSWLDLRAGGTASSSMTGAPSATCEPSTCAGFIPPEAVVVPWQVGLGFAWRFAKSHWNIKIDDDYRDERALVLAADVLMTGQVSNGYGVEAFLDKTLQESGRDLSFSFRFGADFEWIPGWLRVRAGTYWEPGRFSDVTGRMHVTGGIDVRVWQFCLLKHHVRVKASVVGDFASRYGNAGVSVGFWN